MRDITRISISKHLSHQPTAPPTSPPSHLTIYRDMDDPTLTQLTWSYLTTCRDGSFFTSCTLLRYAEFFIIYFPIHTTILGRYEHERHHTNSAEI